MRENTVKKFCPARDNASEADRYYRHYISSLSHEIRNPLTLIYSSLQLIEQSCPSVTENRLWPQVRSDLQYTLQLLADSSALNRDRKPHLTRFSAREFFEELSASVSSLLESRQIRLTLPDEAEVLPELFADRQMLKEAMTNLIINAADALTARESGRRITLRLEKQHTELLLHVTDNGPGVPKEYLSTLFDPFITHKANGTGLGLSIVREIAGYHGGTVSVRTDSVGPDTYSDFCFSLPSACATDADTLCPRPHPLG